VAVNQTGNWWIRKPSSGSLPNGFPQSLGPGGAVALPRSVGRALGEVALLLGSGLLVVALHQAMRIPLGLPGHHGLEWMAILVIVRCSSSMPAAGSISMVGAAAFSIAPFWGPLDDPFIWLVYLVPGIALDLLWRALPKSSKRVWLTALLLIPAAALAHVTKPLVRLVISLIARWPCGSFRYGVLYPVMTHALFGLAGGALGVALFFGWKAGRKRLGKSSLT
jgi:hypothetical protein